MPESDKLIWQAFSFFYETIKIYFKAPSDELLANFLDKTIGDRIMFIKIEVEDEMSAYTLFETLNYRGVDFTVTDLLKNYLFLLLEETDVRVAKDIWQKIANSIGLEKFSAFLRHYWIYKNLIVRQEQLFKLIPSNININQNVFELLKNSESTSSLYLALQDPFSPEWKGNRERFKRVRELELFGVKQQLPLLMISKENFSDLEYDKLLKLIFIIVFRYNVIGSRQANLMEDLYNSV